MKHQIFAFAKELGCQEVKMGQIGIWIVTTDSNTLEAIADVFPGASISRVKKNTYTVNP